jgi:hypothetical protein
MNHDDGFAATIFILGFALGGTMVATILSFGLEKYCPIIWVGPSLLMLSIGTMAWSMKGR